MAKVHKSTATVQNDRVPNIIWLENGKLETNFCHYANLVATGGNTNDNRLSKRQYHQWLLIVKTTIPPMTTDCQNDNTTNDYWLSKRQYHQWLLIVKTTIPPMTTDCQNDNTTNDYWLSKRQYHQWLLIVKTTIPPMTTKLSSWQLVNMVNVQYIFCVSRVYGATGTKLSLFPPFSTISTS